MKRLIGIEELNLKNCYDILRNPKISDEHLTKFGFVQSEQSPGVGTIFKETMTYFSKSEKLLGFLSERDLL